MSVEGPDLVVAGAGGGLVGALRAASLGLSVVVLERNKHFAAGNNTAMSTAMLPGAGSRWQQAAGVQDSAEKFLADIKTEKLEPFADPTAKEGLRLKVIGMPTTILMDAQGREIGRLIGPAKWGSPEAKKLIEAQL